MINLLSKMQFLRLEIFLMSFPVLIPYVIITCADSYEVTRTTAAATAELGLKQAEVKSHDNVEGCDSCKDVIVNNSETSNDVEILSISTVHRSTTLGHKNVLQQLNCRLHKVYGNRNCQYYAVAHRAGHIKNSSHGDVSIGKQLRMLALITMEKQRRLVTHHNIPRGIREMLN